MNHGMTGRTYAILAWALVGCAASASTELAEQSGSLADAGSTRVNDASFSTPAPVRMGNRDGGRRYVPVPPPARANRRDRGGDGEADAGSEDGGLSQIRFEGGDGSSCEMAIVILGAASDFEGVGAEYGWLAVHYPGYELLRQALSTCGDHFVDILRIRTTDGAEFDVYFDIDDFFGE
jgi:hypothetical protein